MKTPQGLQTLIEEGVIDQVLRPLKSGKEASVYVVRCGEDVRCAKVYKDMGQRSFQARVQYQEGRKVRGSRQARAIGKASKFGRKEMEANWKNAEVDALNDRAQAARNGSRLVSRGCRTTVIQVRPSASAGEIAGDRAKGSPAGRASTSGSLKISILAISGSAAGGGL